MKFYHCWAPLQKYFWPPLKEKPISPPLEKILPTSMQMVVSKMLLRSKKRNDKALLSSETREAFFSRLNTTATDDHAWPAVAASGQRKTPARKKTWEASQIKGEKHDLRPEQVFYSKGRLLIWQTLQKWNAILPKERWLVYRCHATCPAILYAVKPK